jgi:hypothetical protein
LVETGIAITGFFSDDGRQMNKAPPQYRVEQQVLMRRESVEKV